MTAEFYDTTLCLVLAMANVEKKSLPYSSEMFYERHQVILNLQLKDLQSKSITGILHHYSVQSQKAQNNLNMLGLYI